MPKHIVILTTFLVTGDLLELYQQDIANVTLPKIMRRKEK